jgi:hypothetical protein
MLSHAGQTMLLTDNIHILREPEASTLFRQNMVGTSESTLWTMSRTSESIGTDSPKHPRVMAELEVICPVPKSPSHKTEKLLHDTLPPRPTHLACIVSLRV